MVNTGKKIIVFAICFMVVVAFCGFTADTSFAGTSSAKIAKTKFQVFSGTGQPGDLPMSGVRSVQEDKNGNLWVATYGGGIAYKEKGTDEFDVYNRNSTPAIKATIVTAAYPDNDGGLWFNQTGNYKEEGSSYGVAYMDKEQNITYFTTADIPQTVPHDYSYCLNIDKTGNVWIGTSLGLTKYDPKTNKWESWTEGFPAKSIQTIEFDNDGGVWLGFYPDTEVDNKEYPYYGGFAYFKDGQIIKNYNIVSDIQEDIGLYRLQDTWVRDIAVDKNGGAWIIVSGIRSGIGMNCIGGKIFYVKKPGEKAVEYTGYGLFGKNSFKPDSEVRKVAIDRDGGLWFGTSKDGVFRVDNPTVKNGKMTVTAKYSSQNGSWKGESDGIDNVWTLDFHGSSIYAGSSEGVVCTVTASLKSASAGKKKLTVKWRKSSDAAGYQVYLKQKGKTAKTYSVKKSTLSKTIKKLKSGKQYTVKVRAYTKADGKKQFGTWSHVKTVKVK